MASPRYGNMPSVLDAARTMAFPGTSTPRATEGKELAYVRSIDHDQNVPKGVDRKQSLFCPGSSSRIWQ